MPTVEGVITGVVEKNSGWTRIEMDTRPGSFDTKRGELIAEARRLMHDGAVVVAEYSERDSRNTNPNTGQPYKDRYFEGIVAQSNGRRGDYHDDEPPREREPERRQAPAETGERGYGWRTHPIDAWRMTLAASAKLAIDTLPLLPVEQRTPEDQWALTLWWAQRIYNQPPLSERFGTSSSSGETQSRRDDSYYDRPPEEEFGF